MKRRIWTIAVGMAAVAAIVAVPAAYAAYTTAKLEVRLATTGVNVNATLSPDDDPTASVRIFAPTGADADHDPGARHRPRPRARGREGARSRRRRPPARGPARRSRLRARFRRRRSRQCLGTVQPLATWVMTLGAAGQTLTVPTYLVATTGTQTALGPAYIQVCLPPPDIPAGTPGRATFGAKLYSADLTIAGVFSSATGTWVSFWTPYRPGVGQVNVAGHDRVSRDHRRRLDHRNRTQSRRPRSRRDRLRPRHAGRPAARRRRRVDLRRPAGATGSAAWAPCARTRAARSRSARGAACSSAPTSSPRLGRRRRHALR